ncbi:hypothetical protein EVAR_88544_1 [Eumeta japonica]|uniref:HAT C-terminal dimerisation domain-containing protein n=1 Tax=Eumeta variegata TaxID=151549 RepID=A0A4C1WNF5_EUMVA|nr:hypothetical protein EVAR_88544_1 [Eumeta japonica]
MTFLLIGYQNPIHLVIRKSITEYLAEKRVTNNVDPLTWWKVNKQRYGLLSPIARQCLVTPPASVPSERMFSDVHISGVIRLSADGTAATTTTRMTPPALPKDAEAFKRK